MPEPNGDRRHHVQSILMRESLLDGLLRLLQILLRLFAIILGGLVALQFVQHGLRVVEPMTLMTLGLYNEPRGAYLCSIMY